MRTTVDLSEPVLRSAKRLASERGVTLSVVVEDAGSGVRAGKAAGARVIGVRGPTELEATLKAAGADWLVDSCADVTVEKNPAEKNRENGALMLKIRTE